MAVSLRFSSSRAATRCTGPAPRSNLRPARFVVRVTPQEIKEVDKKVEEAIHHAEEVCNEGKAQACAVAWDEVEELSAAAAHKKVALKDNPANTDPLEAFCEDNPDADECRIYDD